MTDKSQVDMVTQSRPPDSNHVSRADFVSNLFTAILSLCTKIAQGAARTQHFRCLHNEVERLFLWGECLRSSQAQLEEVFSTSLELHQAVLHALYELGKTVTDDLFQEIRNLIQSEGQDDTLLPPGATRELQELLRIASTALARPEMIADAGSLSDEEAIHRTLEDTLDDVTTYVDCLMDLSPSLENPLRDPTSIDEPQDKAEAIRSKNDITEKEILNRTEAFELLKGHLKDTQISDPESTAGLLDFLAYQTQAIKLASAYLSITGMSTIDYLIRCRLSEKTLIQLNTGNPKDPTKHMGTCFYVAWFISFENLVRESSCAADYLRCISFLAEERIPKSIILPVRPDSEVREALETLKRYAFIRDGDNLDSFGLLGPVRLAMRSWLQQTGEEKIWAPRIIQNLTKMFPFPQFENREIWTAYLPHVQALLDHPWVVAADQYSGSQLVFNAAECYLLLGKYSEAEAMHEKALHARRKSLGVEHPATLDSMYSLANVYYSQGKYNISERMHREALELREKSLGRDHLSTLDSRNNLAVVLGSQGKHHEAEEIHRQTAVLKERIFGLEHFSTLDSLDNLALVLGIQGKYTEAEDKHRHTLALREKLLGPENPSTLNSMSNLAIVLYSQQKYLETEEMHRKILPLKRRIFGPEHPATLDTMSNLAVALGSQGKSQEAEEMHRRTLILRMKKLGLEHPATLDSMNNFGFVLGNQGKYDEAEKIYRETLALRQKILGPEHPATLDSMENLTNVLGSQGKHEEAEGLSAKLKHIRQARIGVNHPDVLGRMSNLAST